MTDVLEFLNLCEQNDLFQNIENPIMLNQNGQLQNIHILNLLNQISISNYMYINAKEMMQQTKRPD